MELLQNKKRDQMNLVAAMQSTLKPGAEQGYHSGGRWTYTGKTSFEGTVIEWSMKFHGRQAEGPSLGGSLRLGPAGKAAVSHHATPASSQQTEVAVTLTGFTPMITLEALVCFYGCAPLLQRRGLIPTASRAMLSGRLGRSNSMFRVFRLRKKGLILSGSLATSSGS